ncbi:EAL domain-containing protein [Shewanella indica]|uniref:EAL domain-containing protein n=1 Tax=Shewanella indica TaxID=768528 RepID=UPI003D35A454
MGYRQLKRRKVNGLSLNYSFITSTLLIFSFFIFCLIDSLYVNFKERQGVFLIYSQLLSLENSELLDKNLSEIVKNYSSVYSVDYTLNNSGKVFPGEYYYKVEYDERGMELVLNIATKNYFYTLRSSKEYLEKWLSRPFVFSSKLPDEPVSIELFTKKIGKIVFSRNNPGFKFSRSSVISVSLESINFILCVYVVVMFLFYFLFKMLYRFEVLKVDELSLARVYLSTTLFSKSVVIKFQPIVHSLNSKILALECLCRVNEREDSAPGWIVNLSDDMCFDLFKASYFSIKRNVDNGLGDIVRVYTINMTAGSVIKYQKDKCWGALSKLVGVRVIIELSNFDIEDKKDINNAMLNLKSLGYRFMIDNFFDDKTSVNLLLTLPIDYIKVGRDFVKGIMHKKNFYFLMSLKGFCHKNDIKIIASGVNSSLEKKLLEMLGIYYQQGFFYSKAKNISELVSVEENKVKFFPCN